MSVPNDSCDGHGHHRWAMIAVLAVAISTTTVAPADATVVTMYATLSGDQEPTASTGTGSGTFTVDTTANTMSFNVTFSGLTSPETAAHIHGPAPRGTDAGILFALSLGSPKVGVWNYPEAQEANILNGLTYVNVHSSMFPGGEIRGQIEAPANPIPTASEWGLIGFALLLLGTGAWYAARRRPAPSA